MTRLRETAVLLLLVPAIAPTAAWGVTLQLDDGRILSGKLNHTAGVAEDPFEPDPSAGEIRTTPILVVEDGLRRTFLHKTAVQQVLDEGAAPTIRVDVWQNVADRGASIGRVGRPLRVTPFDKYGRRIFEMPTAEGSIAVVQGIDRITPVYTRVRGLRAEPKSYLWDMRLATSSLPRDVLSAVLREATDPKDLDARLQVVRLYLQSERYRDARRELERVRDDFADTAEGRGIDFEDDIRQLRQLASRRLLKEIEMWRDAGRHRMARAVLERFPAEGVAGDTLQRVRELLDEDDATRADRATLLEQLASTAEGLGDGAARTAAMRIIGEATARLSPATADRFAAFKQLSRGDALDAEQLAAVAISGWLIGSNKAIQSLPTALALVKTRDDVRRYLAEPDAAVREELLLEIRDADGATVERVAELLRLMAPPLDLPEGSEVGEGSGCYELSVEVSGRAIRSLVQLPPEYDPLSSYPTIVTLGEIGAPAELQLNYWAGAPREQGGRAGQAMRRGYITLAIDWSQPDQMGYGYTGREHAAVLRTLRDAMRRLAIDSDRVYLTGHGAGGDLAWDLALAHPDAWAGVLPFLAKSDAYCGWYWRNAEHTRWRLVFAEMDAGKLTHSERELDRYLSPRCDATVVEYRGRGYDPLSDEVQRAFDWMGRKRRGDAPEEFECATMRPWDSYFWWVEVDRLPEKSMIAPAEWPPGRGVRAATVRGRKYNGNKLGVFTPAERVTVWLRPGLVDFEKPITIEHNGRRMLPRGTVVEPDLRVLLEDARTRAERRRPYWAKVHND